MCLVCRKFDRLMISNQGKAGFEPESHAFSKQCSCIGKYC